MMPGRMGRIVSWRLCFRGMSQTVSEAGWRVCAVCGSKLAFLFQSYRYIFIKIPQLSNIYY